MNGDTVITLVTMLALGVGLYGVSSCSARQHESDNMVKMQENALSHDIEQDAR